jgi:hypothetical protein
MEAFPVKRARELSSRPEQQRWLIEPLWSEQAVGIVGGEPKCFKSFLALDIAVSVASGAPCLRRFPVRRTGPVLLFPAEDALADVRLRIEGICAAAETSLEELQLYLITTPRLALDRVLDRQRLSFTLEELRPSLLILDPLIRLHSCDENQACEIAPILSFLRRLQRKFALAVLLVHHARKAAGNRRPGQALRGSSDLHGWGDSNLYLRRSDDRITLSIEHRSAASPNDLRLQLSEQPPALALQLAEDPPAGSNPQNLGASAPDRVIAVLREASEPLSMRALRTRCRIRTQTLSQTIARLIEEGRLLRTPQGYTLPAVSVSTPPIQKAGNGNGKQSVPSHQSTMV